MSAAPTQVFACPQCGRRLLWAAQLAGSRINCRCGRRLIVPIAPAAELPADPAADPGAGDSAVAAQGPVRPRRVLNYQSPSRPDVPSTWQTISESPFRHLYLPVAIIILGFAFRLVQSFMATGSGAGGTRVLGGLLMAILGVAASVLTMLVGVGLVARWMGSDLGPLPIAALKLSAAAVLGSAAFGGIVLLAPAAPVNTTIIAFHVVLLLYWILFYMFFDLDLQETLFAVAIVGILQAVLACALFNS